ncbi:MAG TPA: transcription termination/antitermination protein NusA, partial [Verrucomicrobiae bacterium]|nr:transcription termination/antitermination protein NusA [Verrucomicrobiae bacterium]
MTNKNILLMIDVVSNEKGVEKEIIFQAMEAALASATKKKHSEEYDVRVAIDRVTGDYETFRRWTVMADGDELFESAERHRYVADALKDNSEAKPGDVIEERLDNVEFGRISAQAAKQVIVQKVREAERAQIVEAYKNRVGELLTGLVKRLERGSVIVDLGGTAEAIIPREQMIPREPLRPGDRVRGYLFEVRSEIRGPQLFLSRTSPKYL